MPVIAIPIPLSPAITLTLVTAGAAVSVISETLKVPLTPGQTAQQLHVATNREAIIDAVQSMLMQGHPSTLPEGVTNMSFQALNQQGIDCDSMIAHFSGIVNTFEDLRKVINNNRMFIATQTLDKGKLLAKGDTGIKTDVDSIVSTYYKKTPKKVATIYSLPISGTLLLAGVKVNRMFTNLGTGILTFINEVGEVAEAIVVNPGSSAKIPAGWTRILVTNLSSTNLGKFSVFMK